MKSFFDSGKERVVLAISLFFLGFVFGTFRFIAIRPVSLYNDDWQLHLSWAASMVNSMGVYGQLPLWNPYRCGGIPLLAEPESNIVAPLVALSANTSVLGGYMLLFISTIIIGLVGFFFLGRSYGLSKTASIFVGIIYMFSGLIMMPMSVGMTTFLAMAYLPYSMIFYREYLGAGSLLYALFTAMVMALMFFSGFHYIGIVIMYQFVYAVFTVFEQKHIRSIYRFGFVVIAFVFFSAAKLFPSLIFFLTNPITFAFDLQHGYSIASLSFSLLSRAQIAEEFRLLGENVPGLMYGVSQGIGENGMYVGLAALVCFLIGAFRVKKHMFPMFGVFLVFLVLSFGTNILGDIYTWMRSLPFLDGMRMPQRYRYIFMVPFALFAGVGLDWCIRKLHEAMRISRVHILLVVTVFLVLISVDMLVVNIAPFRFVRPEVLDSDQSALFRQECVNKPPRMHDHETVSHGLGIINCFDNVWPKSAAVCAQDTRYKGEYYFISGTGTVTLQRFSPNEISLLVQTDQDDTLVVNQNFDPGWQVLIDGKKGKVTEHAGLISTTLNSGAHEVKFYYMPHAFVVGGIVSLFTLILTLVYIGYRVHRKISNTLP